MNEQKDSLAVTASTTEMPPAGDDDPSKDDAPKVARKGFHTKLMSEPQDKFSLAVLTLHLLHVEAKDVTLKWVFDHIRNYTICGLMVWLGAKGFGLPYTSWLDRITHVLGALTLIFAGFMLMTLNLVHGIAAASKVRNFSTWGKLSYLVAWMLAFFAAQILFESARRV